MASRPTSETSSKSSKSSPETAETIRSHTAMHVLRGAIVNVLGPTRFTQAGQGVLRFQSDRSVSPQQAGMIEVAASKKIHEDAEVMEFEMERGEAEAHFGLGIYDLAPTSSASGLLRIARIPEWEASCCSSRHVESTGSIGRLSVDGTQYDGSTKETELRFHIS
jgi:alanyl-tRNA synthetase